MESRDKERIAQLALGRVFGMMLRPGRAGDAEEYERCRRLILDMSETPADSGPNYARDYGKGAQGD